MFEWLERQIARFIPLLFGADNDNIVSEFMFNCFTERQKDSFLNGVETEVSIAIGTQRNNAKSSQCSIMCHWQHAVSIYIDSKNTRLQRVIASKSKHPVRKEGKSHAVAFCIFLRP